MRKDLPRITLKAAVLFAAYLFTCLALHGDLVFSQAVLWLPTGIAIAGLWLLGWRYWPAIALGTLAHRLIVGYSFPSYIYAPIGNSLEALVAVAVLRRFGFRQDFQRLRDVLALLAVAVVAPAVSATVGHTTHMAHIGEASFFIGWAGWWRMNALGVLVVVPLVLSWTGAPPRPRRGAVLEGVALTAAVIGVVWFLITIDPSRRESGMVLSYLALPLALYAAIRFGVRGAATASAAVVVLLTFGTMRGFGPFVVPTVADGQMHSHELALQAVIAIVMTTPLLLGALIAEREAALERVAAERARREELLASINQNVTEGLFRISRDTTLAYVNTAFARMLGYGSPDELMGRRFVDLLADSARVDEVRHLLDTVGQVVGREELFRRRDGTTLPALVSCTAVRRPDGAIESYDGAFSDLTDRQRLEEQLRQTQKMEALGKLAGGVAHDFNNLLTVISGHAELLQLSLPGQTETHTHAREIGAATTRAARLTSQLLAYSRRQMLAPEVLDLRAIVDQSGGMLRRLIGEDIELVSRHAAGELFVRVDRGQMEQVILNLVLNARDAMPRGGTIELSTCHVEADRAQDSTPTPAELPSGLLACLTVKDSGEGMTPDVQRLAFDPFFTTKGPGRGTGLGLSTVYGIVRQSGGTVWIESAPGAGTVVHVCLPRVAPDVAAPVPGPPQSADARAGGTILIVEDEPKLRELLSRQLAAAGCTVLVAEDGVHALDVVSRAGVPLDLVVSDVIMPRMGGRELVTRLAATQPGLRALLISGYAWSPPEQGDPLDGTIGYLQKPFTPSVLIERVRSCLAAGSTDRA